MVSRRCVFLDRDGVVNEKPPAGDYVRSWRDFRLMDSIVDWVRLLNALDLLVIVVTNQRGVARGLLSPADLEGIHAHMLAELARRGARVDDVFCCPHEEGTCDCRKPRPGLVLAAARKWNIDLPESVLIGDSDSDRALAANCGLKFIRVAGGHIVEALATEGSLP